MPLSLTQYKDYHQGKLPNHTALNVKIRHGFTQLSQTPDKESHFFHGRYENIYIERERFPELAPLFTAITQTAAHILEQPTDRLKFGFWFNLMASGDQTTSHSHDDDDELLSCVYYITVPPKSGNLILEPCNADKIIITPHEGDIIFFNPALIHEVSKNLSPAPRLSLACNFGLKS